MYFVARRTASIAMSKQSAVVAGASTARGASALRPWTAWNRSDCSAFVGMPVEGPARCESMTTSGSSVAIARPSISVFSAMPGPEIRLRDLGLLRELLLQPVRRRGALAAVHPQQQAQGPHVAAEVRLARAEAEGLHGIGRELGDVELEELVRRERVVVQRIGLIARLGEVALVERRGVHDDGAANPQVLH